MARLSCVLLPCSISCVQAMAMPPLLSWLGCTTLLTVQSTSNFTKVRIALKTINEIKQNEGDCKEKTAPKMNIPCLYTMLSKHWK